MNLMQTWQFNLFGYLVCVVGFYQFFKLAVRNAKNDGAAAALLQLIGAGFGLLMTPLLPIKWPSDSKYWLLLIGACIFYALNDRLQTTVRKHLQVSVVTILNQLSTVLLFTMGILFFKEPFSLNKFIGVLIILAANVLLRYSKGKFEVNKYIGLAVLAILSFVIAITIDIDISKVFNLPIYIMLTLAIPATMIMLVEKIKPTELIAEFTSQDKKYYLLTGAFWALTIFFSLRSFQLGKVTTIVPLQASNVLLNVLVAYFFLGEKKDEVKKILAAILVIVGITLTTL